MRARGCGARTRRTGIAQDSLTVRSLYTEICGVNSRTCVSRVYALAVAIFEGVERVVVSLGRLT